MRHACVLLAAALSLACVMHRDARGARTAGDPEVRDHGLAKFQDVIRALHEWRGQLWVGTYGGGLLALGPKGVTRHSKGSGALSDDRVNVLVTHGDALWVGTCAGFVVHDGVAWRARTRADGLADDVYHAALSDARGRLWIGTAGAGISLLEGGRWRTIGAGDGLTDPWVNALVEAPDGRIWAAGGVRVFAGGPRFAEQLPPWANAPAAPTALAVRGTELWAGSAFGGLAMYQGGQWYRPPVRLPDPQVNALAADARGRLWVGTAAGIARYHPDEGWRAFGAPDGLEDANVRVLHVSPRTGRLFAGSFLAGCVYAFDEERERFETIVRAGAPVRDPDAAALRRR